MDRKAIIAFVIIGLIVLFYPYYMRWVSPPVPQDLPEQRQDRQETRPETAPSQPVLVEQTTAEIAATDSVLSENAQSPERDIVVDTDLYRAVFSTVGGTLQSWKLKSYEGVDKEWVELVPENAAGALGLALGYQQGKIDLATARFACEAESVVLREDGQAETVKMFLELDDGKALVKELVFRNGQYSFDMRLVFDKWNTQTQEYEVVWQPGLRHTEPDVKEDMARTSAYAMMGDKAWKFDFEGKAREFERKEDGVCAWIGIRTKYFLLSLIPRNESTEGIRIRGEKDRTTRNDKAYDHKTFAVALRMPVRGDRMDHTFTVYLGPQDYDVLQSYRVGLEKCMDMGWTIIRPISRAILAFFLFMHRFIPNYGIVIIIFSVVLKLLFYPLTHKQMEATKKMQDLQPQLAELKTKYKKDPQRLNKETMELYKKSGANPLGGCLPLLLQMPVFFALFTVFGNTIELRQAGFVGWITDLSLKDPYRILPVIMAITMFIQQKMTMKDPKQASMVYLMPAIMFFFFMNFASGLVLYWTVFNLLSIIQQVWTERRARHGGGSAGTVAARQA